MAPYQFKDSKKASRDIIKTSTITLPPNRKTIVLTICFLNRLNAPVRAGIISRSHGVPFAIFKEEFFRPLEHIVITSFDNIIRDYTYAARHPHIAQMVFSATTT